MSNALGRRSRTSACDLSRSAWYHDPTTRTVVFNGKLKAFAKQWGFRPRACAPYCARTKGKTENGVGYVKRNAIGGRCFPSWEAFEAHLEAWTRDIADVRVHGATGEAPIERFQRSEVKTLKPIGGMPPFQATRERIRLCSFDAGLSSASGSTPPRQ
jgi:hypothetical protein